MPHDQPGSAWARLALAGAMALGVTVSAQAFESDILSVQGQPLLALAQRPEVGLTLRPVSGGHRGAIAETLREPGPPIALHDDNYLHSHGCNPKGCRQRGIFLAWDMKGERLFLLLIEEGRVRLSIPPDPRSWPAELGAPLAAFAPALAEAIGKR